MSEKVNLKVDVQLDFIKFGTLSNYHKGIIDSSNSPLSKLFDRYKNNPPPKNSSKKTFKEMQELVIMNGAKLSNDEKVLISYIDMGQKNAIKDYCEKEGIHFDENLYDTLKSDIDGLQIRLKDHYQRPRPQQLAIYLGANLYPYNSKLGSTPSYPSGHALSSYLICSALAFNDLENNGAKLMGFARTISESRMQIGCHFRSDIDFGIKIAKDIVKTSYFKNRYLVKR